MIRWTRKTSRWAALFLLVALALVVRQSLQRPPAVDLERTAVPQAPVELPLPSAPLARHLVGGGEEVFTLSLAIGTYVRVEVEQEGVDIVATWRDPTGSTVLRADSPFGDRGVEIIEIVAEMAGTHRLTVHAWEEGDAAGRYRLRLAAQRVGGEAEERRAQAAAAFYHADTLRRAGRLDDAVEAYEETASSWQAEGDALRQAESLIRLGLLHATRGAAAQALRTFEAALPLCRAAGFALHEAFALHQAGTASIDLGDAAAAAAFLQQALPLRRAAGDLWGEALTLSDLGLANRYLGRGDAAMMAYDRALATWRALVAPRQEADVLHNRGMVYRMLGEDGLARDDFRAAEKILARSGDDGDLAMALNQLGKLLLAAEGPTAALPTLERALALRHEAGDRRGTAVTLTAIGMAHEEAGRYDIALDGYEEAHTVFAALGDRRALAAAAYRLGWLHLRLGQTGAADRYLEAALALSRGVGDAVLEAETHVARAVALRQRGELHQARAEVEPALEILEILRLGSASPLWRASFFATVEDDYTFYIDLLMALHEEDPEGGFATLALEVSERTRARALLETLGVAEFDLHRRIDPARAARQRALRDELETHARQHAWLRVAERPAEAQLAAVERELRRLVAELRKFRARASGSLASADNGPRRVAEIQRALDEESVLLEYKLGRDRSFVWVVTRHSIEALTLAPQAEIESASRYAHRRLGHSGRREGQAAARRALCTLSDLLLAPVAAHLDDKRLWIAADGALHYVPFAALPDPRMGACHEAQPLIARHEIRALPSASTLLALRRSNAGKIRDTEVVVVADPVYGIDDPRLSTAARDTSPAAQQTYPRLAYTNREAAVIFSAVPAAARREALGFEAEKEALLGGTLLGGARIVHMATHGVLNAAHPELSALVLSQVDGSGRPRDGFLYAYEIADLELDADLVVLSACRTALGTEIRGEGLVGLSQSFLQAGAARVLVSLWDVEDRATAELMGRFYRHLLAGGLSPAAALRRAQLTLALPAARDAPYYWAGFVLYGG